MAAEEQYGYRAQKTGTDGTQEKELQLLPKHHKGDELLQVPQPTTPLPTLNTRNER